MRSLQTQPKLQLLCLLGRIAGGQDLKAEVACGSWCARRLVLGNLAEGHVGKDPEMFHTAEFDGWFRLLCRSSRSQINKTSFFSHKPKNCPHPAAGTFRILFYKGHLASPKPHIMSVRAAIPSRCSNPSAAIQSNQPSSGPHSSPHAVPFVKPHNYQRSVTTMTCAHLLLEALKHSSPQLLSPYMPLRSNKHDAHLGDRSKAVGHIGELQSSGW